MSGSVNLYQLVLLVMLLSWWLPLLIIWVRYDKLTHAREVFIATLVWPLILADEVLRIFDVRGQLTFLVGLFQFVPALLAAMLMVCVHKLVQDKPIQGYVWYLLPSILAFGTAIPVMTASLEVKLQLLHVPPNGALQVFWPIYLSRLIVAFAALFFALQSSKLLHDYEHHLSDQVVDVQMYRLPLLRALCGAFITVSFSAVLVTILVALGMFPFDQWPSIVTLLFASIYWLIIMALLQRRRYSPSPLDYDQIDDPKYGANLLATTLKRAEQAVIKYRAYKRIGLRISHLSRVAEVDPTVLAVATRKILKRNFRAFVYHYRLEYAKKVLMRSDAKVASVAKRLGFESEKFLSGMFIKYIQTMGKEEPMDDKDDMGKL